MTKITPKTTTIAMRLMLIGLILSAWPLASSAQTAGEQPDTLQTVGNMAFAPTEPTSYTKQDGDSAYIREDYASAILIYEDLLREGEAAELYYNLAGAYFKSDDIARAVLNYERALLLNPGNADIRANLEIARAKTVDKVTPTNDIFFVSWAKSLTNSLSVDTWARLAIVFFLLMLVTAAFYFISSRLTLRKTGFALAVIFLILTLIAHAAGRYQKIRLTRRDSAIVLTPSVTVRSTPSETGTSLFILHEGRKVSIKDDSMHYWTEIELEDGQVGWVQAEDIEVI